MNGYQGRKVLITGGSSGIGRAAAIALARSGAHVAVAARDQGRLDETVAAMRAVAGEGQRLGAVAVDVTDRARVAQIPAEVLELLGGLDVLICNSGYALPGYVDASPLENFDRMIDVNYMGHVNVVKAFLPHFLAQGAGHISLVSSMLGFMSAFGYAAYSGSKYAIAGFAEALRHELRPHGVQVSLYYPPTTKTPGLERENESKPAAVWAFESESGWNKVYTPEQVAGSLLRSILGGRFENMIGWDSWLLFFAFRLMPGLARWMSDDELKKANVKAAQARAKVE
ncbi:MAG: SDR family oxidoreductase [Deltaproteobacteria bacterium]|nr:SDR family oxidoreductase [Deltaproteobacteria bacterium]